jgi:integrase
VHLWKHPNGTWYVRYGARLRKRISTKTTDRGAAETFLARFIAVQHIPTSSRTVGEIVAGYRADKEKTVRAPAALLHAEKALQPLAPLYPAQLTPPAIRQWATALGSSAGTVLRHVGVLRAALAWAVEHRWIQEVPPISNPVKTPKARERWITKDEAKALLAACREPHVKLFILLGLMTVARSGAILEARWDQVNWDRRTLDYGPGWGNKRRAVVKLNQEIFAALEAAHRLACSPYIVEFRGDRVHTVKNGFAAACRRAKVVGVTPHILRHSGATWMALDAVPMREIARMLGDSEVTTEKTYAKYHPDYLAGAAQALQLG